MTIYTLRDQSLKMSSTKSEPIEKRKNTNIQDPSKPTSPSVICTPFPPSIPLEEILNTFHVVTPIPPNA